jgi:membrane protein
MRDPHPDTSGVRASRLNDRLARIGERYPRLDRVLFQDVRAIVSRYGEDDLGTNAGSLTYGAFLSIPPLLILIASAVGFVISDPQDQGRIVETIVDQIPGLADVAQGQIEALVAGKFVTGAFGLATLLWAASGFAARLRHALGVVFRTERTGLIEGRLRGILTGTPLILGVILLAAGAGSASGLKSAGLIGIVTELAIYVGTFALMVGFFVLVFRLFTPGGTLSVRDHLPGAVLAAVSWMLLQRLGAEYVDRVVARSSALYGALGAVFGLLAFLYLAAYVLLLSAEFSLVRWERRNERTPPADPT